MLKSHCKLFKNTPEVEEYKNIVISDQHKYKRGGSGAFRDKFIQNNPRTPLISIITVVYNGELVLEKTIQSVLNQSYKNVEYIVIDGGSMDGSLEILERHTNNISYWTSGPDEGIADAMNKGIVNSHGDIINFLNAGDYYVDDSTLEYVANWYKEEDWWWAYGLSRFLLNYRETDFKQEHRIFKKWKYYYLTQNCHQATFFRRELFDQIGLHSIGNDRFFDVDFFIRAAQFTSPSTSARMIVWYDITGISTHIKIRNYFSRVYLTLFYCNAITTPIWVVLIFIRWMKSALGFWMKKILTWHQKII